MLKHGSYRLPWRMRNQLYGAGVRNRPVEHTQAFSQLGAHPCGHDSCSTRHKGAVGVGGCGFGGRSETSTSQDCGQVEDALLRYPLK